jgi:hypothetical protein
VDNQGWTNQRSQNLEDCQQEKRFEETVQKALMDPGTTFVGLLITKMLTCLNDAIKTNEDSRKGESNVDFRKFFKKQATNLDVTIFEET